MAKFCKNCGAKLSDNAKFCRGCGSAVDTPQVNNIQALNQAPVQNMGMSAGNVCPNCGNALRLGVRFCRTCGMAVGTNYPAGSVYGMNMMPQKKKRSKLFYPLVALVTALAVAVVSVGGYFLYDRVISPRIGSGGIVQSYEYKKFKDMSYPKGNSKAFSITPVEGITISAEKGALKEDTDITFTPIEDENVYEEYTPALESMGNSPLVAFDFDMGLEPEEHIPGYVDMSFDLASMGIPETLWEDIDIFRMREDFDENEPAGAFEKYAADLSEDGKLTMSTTQNCSIWMTITAGLVKIKGLYAATAGVTVSTPVFVTVVIATLAAAAGGIAWYQNNEQHGHYDKDSTIKMEVRDKWKYDVLVDLKDTELSDRYSDKSIQSNVAELNTYAKKLREEAEKAYIRDIYKKADDGKTDIALFKYLKNRKRIEQLKKTIDKEEYIKAYFEKDEKFNELASSLQLPSSIQTTISLINDSYEYLKAHNIKIKSRVVEFDILPPSEMSALGLKVSSYSWPSYMQLNIGALVKGNRYTETGIDGFRLTCTHEFFHMCQEEYLFTKTKEAFEDTRLEEATAAVLERDASIYYYAQGIQTTNPDPEIGGDALGYVARKDQFCYSLPLNETPDEANKPGVVKTITSLGKTDRQNPWIDIGYTEADLIDFLRAKKGNVSIAAIMNAYADTFPHTRFVDILRSKEAFNIDKDDEWNKLYHEFMLTQIKEINEKTVGSAKLFPEYLGDYRRKIPDTGAVIEWKLTKDNISCAKRIDPNDMNNEKKYIVVLESEPKCKDDLFIRFFEENYEFKLGDRNFSEPMQKTTMVFYSEACRTNKEEPLTIRAICIFEPEQPAFSVSGQSISITTVEAPDELKKKGKITALRTTAAYKDKTVIDDTPVVSDDPNKQLGKDVTIDISGLGNDIPKEDIVCKQAWVYVDTDKNEYVGPEIEGVLVDEDISGTWDLDIEVTYNAQIMGSLIDGYMNAVDMYGQMYGQDSISDVTDLGKMYEDGKYTKSKGTMILKPKPMNSGYEAIFKYNTGAPDETYDGTYDPRTMKLVLKPRKKTTTGSDGVTYDYAQFGLQSDINIQIAKEKDNSGKNRLTLTGATANDPNNPIVAYMINFTGTRVSDKYE